MKKNETSLSLANQIRSFQHEVLISKICVQWQWICDRVGVELVGSTVTRRCRDIRDRKQPPPGEQRGGLRCYMPDFIDPIFWAFM